MTSVASGSAGVEPLTHVAKVLAGCSNLKNYYLELLWDKYMTSVPCRSAGVDCGTTDPCSRSALRLLNCCLVSLKPKGAGVWATLRYEGWVRFHIR